MALAAERDHQVRAIYRTAPQFPLPQQAEVFLARDIFDPDVVATAIRGLDWYAPRPVKLTDGPLTGHVQASDRVTVKSISRADVAWYILNLAEDPAPRAQRTPVITTGAGRRSRSAPDGTPSPRQAPATR